MFLLSYVCRIVVFVLVSEFSLLLFAERERGGKEGREAGRGQGKGDIADGAVVLRRVRVD